MTLTNVDVQVSPEFSSEREIEPLFNRPVSPTWAFYFTEECLRANDINWQESNYVRAVGDQDVPRIRSRLVELCEKANEATIYHLARHQSVQKASDFVTAELEAQRRESREDSEYRLPPRSFPEF